MNAGARARLESDLRAACAGEVRFDPVARSLYATDASPYRIAPHGVVFPRHAADVRAALEVARAHGVPLLMRGGGTSLAGQTVGEAVVVDTSRHLDRVLEVDPDARTARVEPGLVRDRLNDALARWGLHFTPDVSTSDRAAVGGMVANDSAGTRSLKYGKTVDQVLAMTVLLADGAVTELAAVEGDALAGKLSAAGVEGDAYRTVHRLVHDHDDEIRARTPRVMRRVAGYHLDELLPGRPFNLAKLVCGSEGTLAAILDVTLALHPLPRRRVLALLHFDALVAALEAVPAIVAHGPSAVELIDRDLFELAAENPALAEHLGWVRGDPAAVLSVEFDTDRDGPAGAAELEERLAALAADPAASGRAYATVRALDPAAQREVIEFRKKGLGIYATVPGPAKPQPFVEDAAIPVEHLAAYVPQVLEVCRRHGVRAVLYGHASVGVLHVRPLLDLKRPAGVAAYRAIADEVFALVQRYGGSWSGEHGDGLVRSEKLREAFGEVVYGAFREVKRAFDPEGVWNPGKIVDAPPMTANLRAAWRDPPVAPATVLDFGREGLLGAAEACTGVGACRQEGAGTMCPSFRATRDETHVTRGRANALREAIVGALPGGLATRELRDVFDLCLACKACKAECPSRVDVGKMKVELLQAAYDAHGVPPSAWALGGVARLAPLAQAIAPLANAVLPTATARWAGERLLGVDRRRVLPAYARERFDRGHARRTRRAGVPAAVAGAPRERAPGGGGVGPWGSWHAPAAGGRPRPPATRPRPRRWRCSSTPGATSTTPRRPKPPCACWRPSAQPSRWSPTAAADARSSPRGCCAPRAARRRRPWRRSRRTPNAACRSWGSSPPACRRSSTTTRRCCPARPRRPWPGRCGRSRPGWRSVGARARCARRSTSRRATRRCCCTGTATRRPCSAPRLRARSSGGRRARCARSTRAAAAWPEASATPTTTSACASARSGSSRPCASTRARWSRAASAAATRSRTRPGCAPATSRRRWRGRSDRAPDGGRGVAAVAARRPRAVADGAGVRRRPSLRAGRAPRPGRPRPPRPRRRGRPRRCAPTRARVGSAGRRTRRTRRRGRTR